MARVRAPFRCAECGAEAPKWTGQCGDCGAWNSFVEERITPATDTEAEIPAALVQ